MCSSVIFFWSFVRQTFRLSSQNELLQRFRQEGWREMTNALPIEKTSFYPIIREIREETCWLIVCKCFSCGWQGSGSVWPSLLGTKQIRLELGETDSSTQSLLPTKPCGLLVVCFSVLSSRVSFRSKYTNNRTIKIV